MEFKLKEMQILNYDRNRAGLRDQVEFIFEKTNSTFVRLGTNHFSM